MGSRCEATVVFASTAYPQEVAATAATIAARSVAGAPQMRASSGQYSAGKPAGGSGKHKAASATAAREAAPAISGALLYVHTGERACKIWGQSGAPFKKKIGSPGPGAESKDWQTRDQAHSAPSTGCNH
jgi:hypothetical protein